MSVCRHCSICAYDPEHDEGITAAEVLPQADPVEDYVKRYPTRENRTTWKNRVFITQARKILNEFGRRGLIAMINEIRAVAIEKGAIIPRTPDI